MREIFELLFACSNPYAPSDMPEWAWYNGACLRAYQDCTRDALDLPDLGEVNVTLPEWKTIELRWDP